MFHYIYKTTNLINGKVYFGKHSTKNLDDGYLGSGKLLKIAIQKYRKENFKREILSFHKCEVSLNDAERQMITSELINDPQCYNLATGGEGGMILKNITPSELAYRAAATLQSNPEKLAQRNKKIGIKQKEHLAKNPSANDARLKKMNDACRGSKKETNIGIQKQIANRRQAHVTKMNAIMMEMQKHDWQQKNPKALIELLGISGSTFGRMRQKLKNGETLWDTQ
ncbi:GIY-YIG nuclease family protein [Acinetobacter sp.]|uniref:GIY-YIG nuclease family protein n=1 Tax=Acinetobacter sp. TaxID=472 RepID=UPI00388D5FC7